MAPVKPSRHAAVTHRTKESLDAKNVTNPTSDVLHRAKVKCVIADLVNEVASLLRRQLVANGGFMLLCETNYGHGS